MIATLTTPAFNATELEKTRLLILADPSLLDQDKIGRCPVGLTLSRILGRPLTIEDKHDIPELARVHLGLNERDFDAIYRICAWPYDLRMCWEEIPARRDMTNHPLGHLADDEEERAARAEVAAEVLRRFIAVTSEAEAGRSHDEGR